MTGTDFCVNKPHMSRSYLNHLVLSEVLDFQQNKQLCSKRKNLLVSSFSLNTVCL